MTLAGYFALTLGVANIVWTRDEDPTLSSVLLLLAVHVAAGVLIGRWWVAALPFVWAVLSALAISGENSVGPPIAITAPTLWVPALLIGVAIRRALEGDGRRKLRGAVTNTELLLLGVSAAVYLAITLYVSYAVWALDGTVWFDNAADAGGQLFDALILLHVAVGLVVGRWWVAGLPVVWMALSLGAVGPDGTAVGSELIATAPFIWIPAILVGVAIRKFVDSRERAAKHIIPAGIVLVVCVLFAGVLALQRSTVSSVEPETRVETIDEVAGTYADFAIGDSAAELIFTHGPSSEVGVKGPAVPIDGRDWFFDPPQTNGNPFVCYAVVCFTYNRDGKVSAVTLGLLHDAATLRGVHVGDELEDASALYPDLACVERRGRTGPHCTGSVGEDRWIWFGGDPINAIVISDEALH